MEHIKTFLDTSTIHGLSWIANTKRWPRILWILIVVGGFTGAILLIQESFYNWKQSPITTTIEALPISKITYPNVSVCPPKNLFLNLNFDIKKSEKVTTDNVTRRELFDYAMDVIQEKFYDEIKKNLSKVQYPDRYYNWYHGYTEIEYPYYNEGTYYKQLIFHVTTTATSGNISTQYFDDRFNATKVDGDIYVKIKIDVSSSSDKETSITFVIEKKTMKEIIKQDSLSFAYPLLPFDTDLTNWTTTHTPPSHGQYEITLTRKVSREEINEMELSTMPGFRLTWKTQKQLSTYPANLNQAKTKNFIRYIY